MDETTPSGKNSEEAKRNKQKAHKQNEQAEQSQVEGVNGTQHRVVEVFQLHRLRATHFLASEAPTASPIFCLCLTDYFLSFYSSS